MTPRMRFSGGTGIKGDSESRAISRLTLVGVWPIL